MMEYINHSFILMKEAVRPKINVLQLQIYMLATSRKASEKLPCKMKVSAEFQPAIYLHQNQLAIIPNNDWLTICSVHYFS